MKKEVSKEIEVAADRLTPAQLEALPLLASGQAQELVAATTGTARSTIQRWFKQEDFVAEFVRLKAEYYQRAIAVAVNELESQMLDKTIAAKDRAYAAGHLLKHDAMVRNRHEDKIIKFEGLEKLRQTLEAIDEQSAIPAEFVVKD